MSDQQEPEIEVLPPGTQPEEKQEEESSGEIHQPAKVMRIAAMIRTLLEELRAAPLDGPSRERLAEIYQTSVTELSEVLSDDLREELERLSFPFDESPSDAELRIAHAQLVGWLEGLFHGIQAMMFAQQMDARARAAVGQARGLPPQAEMPGDRTGHGQYL